MHDEDIENIDIVQEAHAGFEENLRSWHQDCENLYQEYNTNHDRDTANRLLEELNDQSKQKWEKR
jgi:uncharacterized protein YukE